MWSYRNFNRYGAALCISSFDKNLFCARYFLKFEKFVANKNSLLVETTLRGSDGPVEGRASSSLVIYDLSYLRSQLAFSGILPRSAPGSSGRVLKLGFLMCTI
jgi:hypothetical protein